MDPFEKIYYLFVMPTSTTDDTTLFQGFSIGLFSLTPFLSQALHLPSDLVELTLDRNQRSIRKRTGFGGWAAFPVSIDALINLNQPSIERPYMVIFTADHEVAQQVAAWSEHQPFKPLHVSLAENVPCAIGTSKLTVRKLQQYCKEVTRKALKIAPNSVNRDVLRTINAWQIDKPRPSQLRLHSHNVTLPNEMVLLSTGESAAKTLAGALKLSPDQDYIDAITESAKAVRKLQNQVLPNLQFLITPTQPDLILFAPSTFKGIERELYDRNLPIVIRRTLKAMERQSGYKMGPIEIDSEELYLNEIAPFISIRAIEQKIQTVFIGLKAASILAMTIRLPPSVNRITGLVGHFARHIRSYDNFPPDGKTAKVFQAAQNELLKGISADHLDIISQSIDGIKIISNAPIEWLPINGLPLILAKTVSRINVTPGNMLIQQLSSYPPLHISAESFQNFLVVSMYDENDTISKHMEIGLSILDSTLKYSLTGTHSKPESLDEFIKVANAYAGPVMVVDCHGEHPDASNIGGIVIGGKAHNIWDIRHQLKCPPIVILSACDTHPFDRSHVTTANGFLNCGAIAVLGTCLPIRSMEAAVFLVRLLLRAISFGQPENKHCLSVSWADVITGALRTQFAQDVIRGLISRELLPADNEIEIQLKANMDINNRREDWCQLLKHRCREAGKIDLERLEKAFEDILAGSNVIRYLSIGNPESLILTNRHGFNSLNNYLSANTEI